MISAPLLRSENKADLAASKLLSLAGGGGGKSSVGGGGPGGGGGGSDSLADDGELVAADWPENFLSNFEISNPCILYITYSIR